MHKPFHDFMDLVHEMKQIQNRMYGEGLGPEN